MNLERTVSDPAALADRQEIVDAITSLFIATDEKNWPAALACFADQVHFDMSSLTGSPAATVPADSIVEGWKMVLGAIQSVHHQVGNFRVRIEGNQAVAFCYGITYHYRPNRSGQNTRVIVGTYDFHLARRDAAWRIDGFGFKVKFVDGNQDLEKI
jgi:3-phenylpropionate/cinnamic acid dioxygenase small subunit